MDTQSDLGFIAFAMLDCRYCLDNQTLIVGVGMDECVSDLLDMARVELEHEEFFRSVVAGHRLLPMMKRVFGWS